MQKSNENQEVRLTGRLKDRQVKISDLKDKVKGIDISAKESVTCRKNPGTKHPANLGHYEKKKKTLQIIPIEKEASQPKGTGNIFNKTKKMSPIPGKRCLPKYKRHTEHQIDRTKKKFLQNNIILNIQNKDY